MADFNWDAHPEADSPPASKFDWDQHPAAAEAPPLEEQTPLKTALAHGLDGMTFGLLHRAAEAHAAGQHAAFPEIPKGPSFEDTLAQGAHDNPVTAGVSGVAGALASPANAVGGKLIGGAVGLASKIPGVAKGLSYAIPAAAGIAGAKGVLDAANEEDPYLQARGLASSIPMAGAGAFGLASKVGSAISEPLANAARSKVADTLMKPAMRAEAASAKGYQRFLSKQVSPVGGAAAASEALPADLAASAQGKMAKEIQDSYALARAHRELGLELGPDAQKGLGNLTPDYQSRVNAELGKYAGGKEARLAEIMKALESESAASPASSPAKPPPAAAPSWVQDARLSKDAYDLKPNPLSQVNEASVRARAVAGVPGKIAEMRQQQGPAGRLMAGGIGGATSGLAGAGAAAAYGGGGTGAALVAAPALGVLGALRTAGTDPVVVTAIESAMRSGGAKAQRLATFLAGAQGPMLKKKAEYLMKSGALDGQ